jgi:hypothetical protein
MAYEEHSSKVSAWREGRFIVLPDAEREDCTVWVGAEADSSQSVKWEGLLAVRLSCNRARICAVPFWVSTFGAPRSLRCRRRPLTRRR